MNRGTVRVVEHQLLGERVRDRATGRVGTLRAVYRYVEHVSPDTERIGQTEGHVRPLGGGREWQADVGDLTAVRDHNVQAGVSGR